MKLEIIGNKIYPKIIRLFIPDAKYAHIDRLVNKETISFSERTSMLMDKSKRQYWDFIINPTEKQIDFRNKLKIDSVKHFKYFDPSGKTIGCGCAFCGQLHRTKKKLSKITNLKSALNVLNIVLTKKAQENNYKNITDTNLLSKCIDLKNNYTNRQLFFMKKRSVKSEKKLLKDYKKELVTLRKMSTLLNLPISNRKLTKKVEKKLSKKLISKIMTFDVNTEDIKSYIKLSKAFLLHPLSEIEILNIYSMSGEDPKLIKIKNTLREKIINKQNFFAELQLKSL